MSRCACWAGQEAARVSAALKASNAHLWAGMAEVLKPMEGDQATAVCVEENC